jgi:hypothetical protein
MIYEKSKEHLKARRKSKEHLKYSQNRRKIL